jgi:ATP-binding cassette subfamily B protein
MFSDTIYENIRMGMEGVSEADIQRAARAAQCMEFIERLPKGFETRIGEGGEVHLSGGERQRISLARVFLKNAPVLVLDEATAYADAQNESKIQAAFSEIMKGKTVIVIAHRLSSITDADRIFVIREGRLAEAGLHGELLEKKSQYHSMWQAHIQAQGWALRA